MMHRQWEDFSADMQDYFNAMLLQEQRHFISVVQGLERCNELDVGDLKLMSVKGHA